MHRRPQFRAHERSVTQLHDSTVRVLTPYEVCGIDGEQTVEAVHLAEVRGEGRETLPAQAVVAALGFIADLSAMEGGG